MAGETPITIIGNLTADPEIRYTQSGVAVASFTIASTPRHFDKASGEWKNDDALFLRGTVWRDYAEHVSKSLTKGMRVIATGNLRQRGYETREGEKRTSYELDIDEIGPSLRYATASVTRSQRPDGAQVGNHTDPWVSSSPAPGNAPEGPSSWGGQASASPTDVWPTDSDSPF